jgi:hypothetical protein
MVRLSRPWLGWSIIRRFLAGFSWVEGRRGARRQPGAKGESGCGIFIRKGQDSPVILVIKKAFQGHLQHAGGASAKR